MIRLDIVPHASIGPFKLNASRADIVAAGKVAGLGDFREFREKYRFANSAIAIDFDDRGLAEFISVSASPALFTCFYNGINVFETAAENLFDHIAAGEPSGTDHFYDENEYIFESQILTLYEADEQYDRTRRASGEQPLRPIWAAIGIGTPGYLAAIKAIRAKYNLPFNGCPLKP